MKAELNILLLRSWFDDDGGLEMVTKLHEKLTIGSDFDS